MPGVRWDAFLNPAGFSRGARVVERDAARMGRRIGEVDRHSLRFSATAGRLGPVAVRAFGGAAVAVGGLAAAGAVLGVKTAANLETAQIGFTRLLGSAKRARDFLGDLKSFAARTPFELPGLVDAARALVGAGTAAKDVIPILTDLGDVSGALGLDQERFGRVMIAVTQIMNKGKLQAEELMQITEAGIPVWQLLAKATGKPVPELQKLMQQGKLLSKDVLPLLFKQMHKDYGGGMQQQAKSLNGLWSTFKDTISLTLSDALQPLIPVLKSALPAAGEAFQASIRGITSFVKHDLAPELGRVRLAWDNNKSSILGFATSLNDSQDDMVTSADAARSLADGLAKLTEAAGAAARTGDKIADWLNAQDRGFDESGAKIHDKLIVPITRASLAFGRFFGLRPIGPLQGVVDDMTSRTAELAGSTSKAARAADDHAAALRNEKSALLALQGILADEKTAELDLRQAKINVSAAQSRLNDLKKQGRTRSFEYKQAQLDLERAQIDLKHKTDDYRNAQRLANSATGGAMHASQLATRAHKDLAGAEYRAGSAAWLMGNKIRDGMLRIPKGRIIRVSATFGFHTPPGVSMHDIVGARGGLVTPGGITPRRLHRGGFLQGPGTETSDSIPARLSKGEYVVNAKAVRSVGRGTLDDLNARGFARGGIALDANFPAPTRLLRSFGRFERVIDRIITRLAGEWDRYADRFLGRPGVQAFIRSTDPLPYRWGAAGPGAYDCSGLVGAVYGKHTGRGGGHGQRYFTTASIRATGGLKPGLGGVLNIGVTPGQGHMAGSYAGLPFEARGTASGIIVGRGARSPASFARHFHMARGGLVDQRAMAALAALGLDLGGDAGHPRVNGQVFDRGGMLMPGATLAVNRTGHPEPVGIDYDALADALVRALRRQPVVAVVDPRGLQAGMNRYAGQMGQARPFR